MVQRLTPMYLPVAPVLTMNKRPVTVSWCKGWLLHNQQLLLYWPWASGVLRYHGVEVDSYIFSSCSFTGHEQTVCYSLMASKRATTTYQADCSCYDHDLAVWYSLMVHLLQCYIFRHCAFTAHEQTVCYRTITSQLSWYLIVINTSHELAKIFPWDTALSPRISTKVSLIMSIMATADRMTWLNFTNINKCWWRS